MTWTVEEALEGAQGGAASLEEEAVAALQVAAVVLVACWVMQDDLCGSDRCLAHGLCLPVMHYTPQQQHACGGDQESHASLLPP